MPLRCRGSGIWASVSRRGRELDTRNPPWQMSNRPYVSCHPLPMSKNRTALILYLCHIFSRCLPRNRLLLTHPHRLRRVGRMGDELEPRFTTSRKFPARRR